MPLPCPYTLLLAALLGTGALVGRLVSWGRQPPGAQPLGTPVPGQETPS